MSFRDAVRQELISSGFPEKSCCTRAFLSAISRITGSIEVSKRRFNLCLKPDGAELGIRLADAFKSLYPIDVELSPERGKPDRYKLRLPTGMSKQILIDFELMRADGDELVAFNEEIPQDCVKDACCKIAYVKGLFLACGFMYVPENGSNGYHFEFDFDDDVLADGAMELLSDIGIVTRMSVRGERRLVYSKDKDMLMKLLSVMGLTDCALRLKAIIDERETANSLNRAAICETANLDKTYSASTRLMIAIAKLKSEEEYDNLPVALKVSADARAAHPEASLNELAQILGVTKSCLNHRFRKLLELAESI